MAVSDSKETAQEGSGNKSATPGEGASFGFKMYILLVLTMNATGYILLIRFTRSRDNVPMYFSTTTVLLSEVSKLTISLMLLTKEHKSLIGMMRDVYHNVLCNPSDTFKMCIPSIIYALQNNLAFVALSNLDAATYQITYQLKIITTAMFMVVMIGKKINPMQWLAIFLLFAGVAAVQVESANTKEDSSHYNYMKGLIAIIVSCLCSGFAGVYFEKVLKGTETTLWIRNVQMYLFGIISGLVAVFTKDYKNIMDHGFLYGYDAYVCLIIAMASIGGLYTSIVVKYLDNIVKGFSTAVSIVLAAVGSFVFFGKSFGYLFMGGSALVTVAIYLYSLPKPAASTPKARGPQNV
ncbi:CMP-sialic acid transporter-like isoform X1 [Lytechinus variegatus]|uniref:CMP-sialic acid transporter-like isoform X1 n=1 Tax=Lytechinus variegatus TaxID=7654 RepID=UPI001BB172A4|nr:CMP-sialic acid transporter-like isoform X1 [Lytechinus variegatus]